MQIVTLDFETFYDQEYSLSKMTTEAYLRDPRFEIIGVSKKIGKGKPVWFSGTHAQVREFLLEGIDWSDTALLAHNTAFDGGILVWHLGLQPKLWLDSMSMGRPRFIKTVGVSLDALSKALGLGHKGHQVKDAKGKRRADFTPQELHEYGEYCINDSQLCYDIFRTLAPEFDATEIGVISATISMFTNPVFRLNREVLEDHLSEVRLRKEGLLLSVGAVGRDKFMSNDMFADLLRNEGVEPPMKVSKTTGKLTYAFAKTDKGLKDLLDHPSETVQALVTCRLGVKSTIEETRTEALIGISKRGLLPIMLNYWGAGTGRFSGGDGINPQNFTRGGKIRKAIEAIDDDHEIVVSDLSQIEARIVALVSGQLDLVQAFAERRDIYSEFASEIYGETVTKANVEKRFVGKTCILGLGYQMGGPRLRESLRIGLGGMSVVVSPEEAEHYVQVYRTKNRKIKAFWRTCQNAVEQMALGGSGYISQEFNIRYEGSKVLLPNGQILRYPGLKRDAEGDGYVYFNRKKISKIYGGLLCENIVQALARGVIVECLLKIHARYGVALQVHDEIVSVVLKSLVAEAKEFIEREMSVAPLWLRGLPVACETGSGPSYGAAK